MTDPGAREADADGILIRIRGLGLEYHGSGGVVMALRDVSLEVRRGEFVCLMGPSGSGKTTLVHILGGLLTPTQGQVLVDGRDVARLDDAAASAYRNRTVGFVFQFFNLQPYYTAVENVSLPLLFAGIDPAARLERARRALAAVGLSHREAHRADELSGGEMQRVAIARAIVNEPRLVLADEPTGNLDSASTTVVMDLLARINRDSGVTLVIVTHNDRIAAYAHRTVRIDGGAIA